MQRLIERPDNEDRGLPIGNLNLKINNRALSMAQSRTGVSYPGRRIYPGTIRVKSENKNRSLKRLNRKIKLWEKGKIKDDALTAILFTMVKESVKFLFRLEISLGIYPLNKVEQSRTK